MSEKTLPANVASLMESGGGTHINDIASALFTEFGGPVGIAKTIKKVFDDADAGSAIRERIAESLVNLQKSLHKEGLTEEKQDWSALDVGELERQAMELLNRGT